MTLETWFKNLELFKPDWNVCKTTENKFTFSYILYILNSLDLTLQKESKKRRKSLNFVKIQAKSGFGIRTCILITHTVLKLNPMRERYIILKLFCINLTFVILVLFYIQLLRLGFHDCLTYENPVDGAANGCDGCLNPDGMGINMFDDLGVTKNSQKGPNVDKTNNNGLTFTADVLEEIYTNKDFPNGIESLEVSMKESGKSRADLWAFATLVALQYGIDNNNLACQGEPRDACGHLEYGKEGCEVPWPSIPKFKTGRTDCVSPDGAEKPWHTSIDNHEVHPRPHGNGPETVDFYKTNFGLTAREAIALQEGLLLSHL